MAKKRLSVDLELDDYIDKKIWDYLETKKVKSKAIKSIIAQYLDGTLEQYKPTIVENKPTIVENKPTIVENKPTIVENVEIDNLENEDLPI